MKTFSLLLLFSAPFFGFSQYWQQKVDYTIDVQLNDREKTLDGFVSITYHNNSPDTLSYIWFHLWPNAYKNDKTAFSDQLLENGNTSFYFSKAEERGYINRLAFKVDGHTAAMEDHPQHIDIVKLILPNPLPPGRSINITTPFHVKLPYNFSRGGYDGLSFQITQWYPKPAVYDSDGWHAMPYLDQGEFYSEFGSFDVKISVPAEYVVAATGQLQDEREKQWLKNKKNVQGLPAAANKNFKTLHFKQDSVHDIAWFATREFMVDFDTLMLSSGNTVEVWAFYTEAQKQYWDSAVGYAKAALRFYSHQIGNYPYKTATVVQGPQSFGGGMEYPTITVISPVQSLKDLDLVIAHELGHNWFYGMLASNERSFPWMDEGMNSFYTNKYEEQKYGRNEALEIFFQTKAFNKTDQPINTRSEDFSSINYGLIAYHKAARWMALLEDRLGAENFRQVMQQYFNSWKFKHPQPEDFKAIVAEKLGNETENFFKLLNQKGILPEQEFKGFSLLFALNKNHLSNYIHKPTRQALIVSPALGFNVYDKVMAGGLLTNYKLPPPSFRFLVLPLYAMGSKSLNGFAKLNYRVVSEGFIRSTDLFFNASRFSMNRFIDSSGKQTALHFEKFVPGLKLSFKQKPRSTSQTYLQWKTFFINENIVRGFRDTLINPPDTIFRTRYSFPLQSRYVNELKFLHQNLRALYPYDMEFQVHQSNEFLSTRFTSNYFFNYAAGGGLNLRLFAGKFFYLKGYSLNRQIQTMRYQLNMTGANGNEDYTYSDYFIGRNEYENLWSQQMMLRDGGFKVRTDLLSSKVGKTDDWLVAVNLLTTIPDKLNPLTKLPIKLPLRLFADVGTYAAPWEKNSTLDRFLFDAGFNLSLFRNVVNLYFPVVYSQVYGDYFKSTISKNRFFKTMSFTIDFFTPELKKINKEVEF